MSSSQVKPAALGASNAEEGRYDGHARRDLGQCLVIGRVSLALEVARTGEREVSFIRTGAVEDIDATPARLRAAGVKWTRHCEGNFFAAVRAIDDSRLWSAILIDTADPAYHPNFWAPFEGHDALVARLAEGGVLAFGPLRTGTRTASPKAWLETAAWPWLDPEKPRPVGGGWHELARSDCT